MVSMNDAINKLKPTWDYRRKFIAWLLGFLAVMIAASLGGAVYLGSKSLFGFYIGAFMSMFVVCAFLSMLGIIGSYIFGARWETKDYLEVLPKLIPNLHPDEPTEPEIHNDSGQ